MDQQLITATLTDQALEAEFRERGFVVVDLVGPDEVARLAEISDRVYVDVREGFHASNLSKHHEYRHAVNREVTPVLEHAARDLFVDHEPYFSSLVIKWPDPGSMFPSHQDWNMVDESRFRSVNIFCPLVDATAENGALRVLPGSHRVLTPIRCSPMPPTGCESVGWQVGPDEMEVVEVRVGQVLVFDHALLHCSAPNLTDGPRWAVVTAFKPRGAELFHWYLPDPDSRTLEVFSVGSDFFADIDIGARPAGTPVRTDQFEWDPITKDELLARCGGPPSGPTGDRTGILRDPTLQAQLDELGWVVVDLLDARATQELRAAYDALPHRITVDRSFARGFHATIIDDRADYRRASHEAIAAVVAGPAQQVFDRMRMVFTNWVTKEPGADAAPYHVDWTFADEDRHQSVSIWMPLVDTDEQTGCIGVVDGSHHRVDFIRAAAHPTYHETDRFGRSLPGAHTVPLGPGQAVIFDHRLVHFSMPHDGPGTRVAVTCEFVPEEADLLHYEQLEPGRFVRHTVSPEFYVTYSAGSDPSTVPGHLGSEVVEGRSFDGEPEVESSPLPSDDEVLGTSERLRVAVARRIPRRVRRVLHPR